MYEENIELSSNLGNNGKLVKLIAIWILLVSSPWIHYFYQQAFIPQSLLDVIAIFGIAWILFCALGLVFNKEVARRWALWMLTVYFFWSLYLVCFHIAPFFTSSVEWLSVTYHIPAAGLKNAMLTLLITHIMWPLIVIMYLTNPNVKSMFN
jgi:hypothetical protein